jgi:hypothetical protein
MVLLCPVSLLLAPQTGDVPRVPSNIDCWVVLVLVAARIV